MKDTFVALKRHLGSVIQSNKERRHHLVGPSSLWMMKRDFQIQFLKKMGLKPEHYLFDIGCGTLRGGIPIIDYLNNGHYFGSEVRPEVLEEGQQELRDAGLDIKNPTLIHSPDISKISIDQKFDFIWAFSVLIHMNDDILRDTLRFVSNHLSDDGAFYTNVNIGEKNEGNWQEFPVVWRTLEFYNQECFKNNLNFVDIGSLKSHGHRSNIESQDNQTMLCITKK